MATAARFIWPIAGLVKVAGCLATVNFVSSSRYQLGSGPWVSNNVGCTPTVLIYIIVVIATEWLTYSSDQYVCTFVYAVIIFVTHKKTDILLDRKYNASKN